MIHVERIPSVGDYFDDALDRLVGEDEAEKSVRAGEEVLIPLLRERRCILALPNLPVRVFKTLPAAATSNAKAGAPAGPAQGR
jgi:hypothetical protein